MTSAEAASETAPAGGRVTQRQLDYMGEVIRLRLVQEMNFQDTRRTHEEDEQIVYVADSSIFYFYINTFAPREHRQARAMPQIARLVREGLTGADRKRAERQAISTAVITAEYLFSGKLPGQGDFPLYITDEHAGEFQKRVSEILREITETAKVLTEKRRRDLSRRANGLAQRLKNLSSEGGFRSPEQIRKLRDVLDVALPDLVSDFELAEVDRAVNLLHLMEGDVVRPLRLAPGIDRNLLNREPDADRVGAWKRRLQDFTPGELYQVENAPEFVERTQNLSADARVLARLEEINTDCRRRNLNTRFVLITTSAAMQSASAFQLQEEKLPLSASLVRPLTQFVPLLNFRDMPNFVESHNATLRLRAALDGLFQWKRALESQGWATFLCNLDIHLRGLNRLKRGIDDARSDAQLTEQQSEALIALRQERMDEVFVGVDIDSFTTSLRSIGKLWDEMVQNSIGLNARLLLDHYDRHLGKVSAGLASLSANSGISDGLSETYQARQFNLTDKLSRIHLRMAARLMMANPRSPSRQLAETVRGARPSLYLAPEDEQALVSVVGCLIEGEITRAETELMAFADRPHLGVAELNLAVSTVALRVGLWDNAANFAHHAEVNALERAESRRDDPARAKAAELLAAEAVWQAGTARRIAAVHHLKGQAWESAALLGLDQARRYQERAREVFADLGDFLGQARSMAEIALIDAARATTDLLHGREIAPEKLTKAWHIASEAHILIAGIVAGARDRDGAEIVPRRTRLMAEIGLIETALLAWLIDQPLDNATPDDLSEILAAAERDMAAIGRKTFACWPLMLDLFRATGANRPEDLEELRGRCDELGNQAETRTSAATDLEVFFLARVIEQLEALQDIRTSA